MQALRDVIERYTPFDPQEAQDRRTMLYALDALERPLSRDNPIAHFTASSWIVSPDRTRALMAFHNIYRTWAWTGGHADGEADLMAVAIREAQEETGIASLRPLLNGVFSLEILPVNAHIKRGRHVSAHLHLNLTYLLEADPALPVRARPGENSAVAWLPLEEAADNREEPFMAVIYRKLNKKLKAPGCQDTFQ